MTHLLDNLLVGMVCGASAAYAAFALGPKSWRGAVARRLAALVPHIPTQLRLRRAAQRLSLLAAAKAGGACGGCDNCGSETAAKSVPDPAGRSLGEGRAASEVRIAVAKIGRRR